MVCVLVTAEHLAACRGDFGAGGRTAHVPPAAGRTLGKMNLGSAEGRNWDWNLWSREDRFCDYQRRQGVFKSPAIVKPYALDQSLSGKNWVLQLNGPLPRRRKRL